MSLEWASKAQAHARASPLCILPLEQDVRSQSAYLPTAMLLTMMVKLEASHQRNAFLYKLHWSQCFVTATKLRHGASKLTTQCSGQGCGSAGEGPNCQA